MMMDPRVEQQEVTPLDSHNQHAFAEQDFNMSNDTIPSEAELVLLCLDYLRDLRRSYHHPDASGTTANNANNNLLETVEGLNGDYITLACWALNRAFVSPPHLKQQGGGNDAFFVVPESTTTTAVDGDDRGQKDGMFVPSLREMERELLYSTTSSTTGAEDGDQKKEPDEEDFMPSYYYDYNDAHMSNSHRFYPLAGLACGGGSAATTNTAMTTAASSGPLTLGEIAGAGLAGLAARSRLEADRDMVQSPLFLQFVTAVQEKGFFEVHLDNDNNSSSDVLERETKREQEYEERYRKVVAKFRSKLARKAHVDAIVMGGGIGGTSNTTPAPDLMALSAAEQQRQRRAMRIQQAHQMLFQQQAVGGLEENVKQTESNTPSGNSGPPTPASYIRQTQFGAHQMHRTITTPATDDAPSLSVLSMSCAAASLENQNPVDVELAEKLKNEGNTHMQCKEFPQAADCYTRALKLSPTGPHSHVYFSNRAAAYVSMKRFQDAICDSERSLALKPDYGKAHARLGLAYFLLGNYRHAMEAYTVALKYEPDNRSSKNYLEKAAKRLAAEQTMTTGESSTGGSAKHNSGTSFSVVSEWEKSKQQKQQQQSQRQLNNKTEDTDRNTIDIRDAIHDQELQQQILLVQQHREAEKYKTRGNSFMANRDYEAAMNAYTKALELSPNGSQSHVYYSNRAAALCYVERYADAEADSLKSLSLNPTYGKAHARLGLSRFLMQDYAGAVEAYTAALSYDPDNAASKSYLAKAKAKQESVSTAAESAAKELDSIVAHTSASTSDAAARHLLQQPEMLDNDNTIHDPSILLATMTTTGARQQNHHHHAVQL